MPALADMSSAQAVDRSIAHFRIRDSGVALATQAGGGSVRTSEHPLLSVRRAANRLAPTYPFPGEHYALLLRPSHAQRRPRLGGICRSTASRRARAPPPRRV